MLWVTETPRSSSPLSLFPNPHTSYSLPQGRPSSFRTPYHPVTSILIYTGDLSFSFSFFNFLGAVTLSDRLKCFLFYRLSKSRCVFPLLKAMGTPSMQNAPQGIPRWRISEERHLHEIQEQKREGASSNWVWEVNQTMRSVKNWDHLYFNLHPIPSTLQRARQHSGWIVNAPKLLVKGGFILVLKARLSFCSQRFVLFGGWNNGNREDRLGVFRTLRYVSQGFFYSVFWRVSEK